MKEIPNGVTPWKSINQLLFPQERFERISPDWKGFLCAPTHPSRLAALLYSLREENIPFCVDQESSNSTLVISPRAFLHLDWYEDGVVEVGAGCSLSLLQQFLFERKQEVMLEEDIFSSSKERMIPLILSKRIANIRSRNESLVDSIVGMELVTWEGGQVKWGGKWRSSPPGPAFHQCLDHLPGIVVKIFLKTYPIPEKRLRLAWSFKNRKELWEQYEALSQFSQSWEYLDVVLSGDSSSRGYIFAQISGFFEEIELFTKRCPGYGESSQKGERIEVRKYLRNRKLQSISVAKNYIPKEGEFLWISKWKDEAALFFLNHVS